MREEIDTFKKQNGNVSYTVKELIQALHTKIDKNGDVLREKASKKMVLGLYGTVMSLIGALTYYIFVILP